MKRLCFESVFLLAFTIFGTGHAMGNAAPQGGAVEGDSGNSIVEYTNPILADIPGGGVVENCPDPSILYSESEERWYVGCTSDPLNDDDRDGSGNLQRRLLPLLASDDLVNWEYVGDVFDELPAWVAPGASLWAPELVEHDGLYFVYYTATEALEGGPAIGVATAPSPEGPWTDAGPVVEPRTDRWQYDPEVVQDGDDRYLFFGSYFGGVFARELTPDGTATLPDTETRITIANRYEGVTVVERDGYWYLFASATDCCRGALTGYSVFVGRADDPLGPYVDRDGASFLDGRVGGTPVISMNGNRWVGPGHNAVFTDFDGQGWFLYHAVNSEAPYFEGAPGFTKRFLMLDPLDWIDGWPAVRGGRWASDFPVAAPAAQPGETTGYEMRKKHEPGTGPLVWREDFEDGLADWSWVRSSGGVSLSGGKLHMQTRDSDLFEDRNDASVLLRDLPEEDWIVETILELDVPTEGCCYNHVQAGLVIYAGDNRYIKLVKASLWETRQVEFGKEVPPDGSGLPRYGNTVGASPGDRTHLRIARRTIDGAEHYTAFSRRDGGRWTRAGTWTHDLGDQARVGLVAMGGDGFTASFEEVAVRELRERTSLMFDSRDSQGHSRLWLDSRPRATYVLEATGDFAAWEPVAERETNAEGSVLFVDPESAFLDRRFYRARPE